MDLEVIRSICMKLPATMEDIKWGNNLVFSIGAKMYCMTDLEPPFRCSFKVKADEFESIIILPGFMAAPYLARAHWVMVIDPHVLHKEEWQHYLAQSYELVKQKLTKKEKASIGID
ncbi:MAG: MmcQ/YjbR family DNA-binding protein [Candidatus Dadabacteria bacterium]